MLTDTHTNVAPRYQEDLQEGQATGIAGGYPDEEFGNAVAEEVTSNITQILDMFTDKLAEDITGGGLPMPRFRGYDIPPKSEFAEELSLDFVEGFGADSRLENAAEPVEGDNAGFYEEFAAEYTRGFPGDSMATLKRDFGEGMSELEVGVEELPYISE